MEISNFTSFFKNSVLKCHYVFIYFVSITNHYLTDNSIEKMPNVYNIEVDQLKCNFCTKWFTADFHFCNIQRYSLKACERCIKNIKYTIVHPVTHEIYSIFVVNCGFSIDIHQKSVNQSKLQQGDMKKLSDGAITELNSQRQAFEKFTRSLKEDYSLKAKERIERILLEWEKVNEDIKMHEIKAKNIFDHLNKKLGSSQFSKDYSNQLLKTEIEKINQIQEQLKNKYQRLQVMNENLKLPPSRSSSNLLSKENIPPNHHNIKNLKNKVLGSLVKSTKNLSPLNTQTSFSNKSQQRSRRSTSKDLSKSILQVSVFDETSKHSQEESSRKQVYQYLSKKPQIKSYFNNLPKKTMTHQAKNSSQKNQAEDILEVSKKVIVTQESLEIVGANFSKIDLGCLLKVVQSKANMDQIKVVRIIKSGMTDADFDWLLDFSSKLKSLEVLVASNNRLTELVVESLAQFKNRNSKSRLRYVYLGNNHIKGHSSENRLESLQKLGVHLFI